VGGARDSGRGDRVVGPRPKHGNTTRVDHRIARDDREALVECLCDGAAMILQACVMAVDSNASSKHSSDLRIGAIVNTSSTGKYGSEDATSSDDLAICPYR
jgi:hypothetical protein